MGVLVGALFKLFCAFIRAVVHPMLRAIEQELDWKAPPQWDLSKEIKNKMGMITKERLEVILHDSVVDELVLLKADLKRAVASIGALEGEIVTIVGLDAKILIAVKNHGARLKAIERKAEPISLDKKEKDFEREFPGDAETEAIEW